MKPRAAEQNVRHHLKVRRSSVGLFTAVAAAFAGVSARAIEVTPPPTWSDELPGEGTLAKQPVVGLSMGRTFVRLEKTTLHSILELARVGAIGERGDGGGHISFVCFTDEASSPRSRIWLLSNAMGNPDKRIIEVNAVVLSKHDQATEACPKLPTHLRPVALDRGIWLGTSIDLLTNKLGRPSGVFGGWHTFNYFGTSPGPYHGGIVNFDVISVFGAQIERKRINALRATRVTSY